MWTVLEPVLTGLTSIAVMSAVVGWIVKTVVSHQLGRDMERYKTELKDQTDRELERLRTQEKMRALEHEVRFKKLHDRVAEAVCEVFLRLDRLYAAAGRYMSPIDWDGVVKDEKEKIVAEAVKSFVDYFYEQRLFLPADVFSAIDDYWRAINKAVEGFAEGRMKQNKGVLAADPTDDHWTRAMVTYKQELEPGFLRVHALLQAQLGLASSVAATQHDGNGAPK